MQWLACRHNTPAHRFSRAVDLVNNRLLSAFGSSKRRNPKNREAASGAYAPKHHLDWMLRRNAHAFLPQCQRQGFLIHQFQKAVTQCMDDIKGAANDCLRNLRVSQCHIPPIPSIHGNGANPKDAPVDWGTLRSHSLTWISRTCRTISFYLVYPAHPGSRFFSGGYFEEKREGRRRGVPAACMLYGQRHKARHGNLRCDAMRRGMRWCPAKAQPISAAAGT